MGNSKSDLIHRPVDRNILELLPDGFYKNYCATIFFHQGTVFNRKEREKELWFFTGTVKNGNIIGYAIVKYITELNIFCDEQIVFFENGVVKGHSLGYHKGYPDRAGYIFTSNDRSTLHFRTINSRAVVEIDLKRPTIHTTTQTIFYEHQAQTTFKAVKDDTKDREKGRIVKSIPTVPIAMYDVYDPTDWEFLRDLNLIGKIGRDVRDPSHPDFVYR